MMKPHQNTENKEKQIRSTANTMIHPFEEENIEEVTALPGFKP